MQQAKNAYTEYYAEYPAYETPTDYNDDYIICVEDERWYVVADGEFHGTTFKSSDSAMKEMKNLTGIANYSLYEVYSNSNAVIYRVVESLY